MEILDPRTGDGMWLLLGLKLMMILKLMTGSHAAIKLLQQENGCALLTRNGFRASALVRCLFVSATAF